MVGKSKLLFVALTVFSLIGPSFSASLPAFAKHDSSDAQVCEEVINNKPYATTKTLVKARPEQVWQVLTDYSSATKVFPTLKKCRVISDAGHTKRVHYQIHPTGVMTSFQYDLEMKEHPHKMIEWHRVSGDFKAVEGFWRLEPVDGGRSTMVTYASYVNGGMFMPHALIKRQSRIDLPQVMAALKQQSETTTQIAARGHNHVNHTNN